MPTTIRTPPAIWPASRASSDCPPQVFRLSTLAGPRPHPISDGHWRSRVTLHGLTPCTGAFVGEAAWVDTGGGASFYETRPSYQSSISTIVGTKRGVPGLSAVADPNTGVWVYDSGNGGWWIVGGTSAAAPILAGIVNLAGHFAPSTSSELTTVYNNMALAADFRDTTTGFCGPYMGYSTARGWDFCTGAGSPYGLAGK